MPILDSGNDRRRYVDEDVMRDLSAEENIGLRNLGTIWIQARTLKMRQVPEKYHQNWLLTKIDPDRSITITLLNPNREKMGVRPKNQTFKKKYKISPIPDEARVMNMNLFKEAIGRILTLSYIVNWKRFPNLHKIHSRAGNRIIVRTFRALNKYIRKLYWLYDFLRHFSKRKRGRQTEKLVDFHIRGVVFHFQRYKKFQCRPAEIFTNPRMELL